jgi:ATP-dependent helicase/nuclease subunit B
VRAHFLLGPAGSGKTFRCLAEIRAALAKNPEGAPLVFLAPKQATFQLERQLLTGPEISGYTRLQIFSFERLAQSVLEKLKITPPKFLSDDGRLMVLRALLMRHADELKLFRQSARRPGFAQELGRLLNELSRHQQTPAKLRALAGQENLRSELRDKLNDLALLSEKYADWLRNHGLQDGNHLLDFATAALRDRHKTENSGLKIEGLWLDGFAEMTPQELDLLAAVLPFCENATLAFCVDESGAKENSWLSIWSAVGKSFQQCRQRIENLPGFKITTEFLSRDSGKNRFAKNPILQHLERSWPQPNQNPKSAIPKPENTVQIVACQNPEAEAVFTARTILKFVRAGNRFRDCAVLVRNLENYHKPLAREFRRYGISFFLDRRAPVAHHPLAELTRGALRTVAFDWRTDDLFAALKTGFSPAADEKIDELENAALEFGWRGKKWREPLPDEKFEALRWAILPPFENFHARLAKLKFQPDGKQLAEILRGLWNDLNVEQELQNWSDDLLHEAPSAIHATVWGQMNAWLENLELAFQNEKLPLRGWLPVLEAGLANLTVGVIPPVLDEVLIGAIDRARNPDLKLALVLGVNETVFPAPPVASTILTDSDRAELGESVSLGPDLREQISRERFYGYIACTRAAEKLVLTFSRQGADDGKLNPSPFVAHLQNIFPALAIEDFENKIAPPDVQHAVEITPFIFEAQNVGLENQGWRNLLSLPAIKTLVENLARLREPDPEEKLSPSSAEKLYGPVLRSSVSRLEEFAACPFRFFVRSGLRADERKIFELDARERGNFQHEVLKKFHDNLQSENLNWRDLTPAEARERIGKIANELTGDFRDGLLRDSAESLFAARALAESLQDFVAVIVAWLRDQNGFDPSHAELDFGKNTPPWEISLGDGHKLALSGRIDRVDLWRDPANGEALALVLDYKSSSKELDEILVANGVQLQLLAYLSVLRHWKNPREFFGADRLHPAGGFYVNLRGKYKGGARAEILADADAARREAYRHSGRFDASALDKLDSEKMADQFSYQLKNNGELFANSKQALPRAEFLRLLDGVETQLHEMGQRIFSGDARVDPYRKGGKAPCDFCDYQAACRIDKWTHHYRVLSAKEKFSDIPEPS